MYVGMLNSVCFSTICEAQNMQSMQDLPFLNPFCSSNSKASAIVVSLFAIIFEYICALLSGSDGKLYSLPFHPQPSPELPGSFVNTVRAVSTKHPVALLALSSSHVAVYGADPSEEGELLLHQ